MRCAWLAAVLAIGCGRDDAPAPSAGSAIGSGAPAHAPDGIDERKRRAWRSSVVEPGATTCATFAGEPLDATWSDCTDHVRRELACAKDSRGELECRCLEDGVEKWRFTARDPRLAEQAEATRVARSNCHMSFEGF